MLRYALALAVLSQSNLPMVLAANINCTGIEYAKVCCNGHIIGPAPTAPIKLNNIDGLTCCLGDVAGKGIASTCTVGSPIPMTQLASAQANDTIVSAFLSVTENSATPTPTSTNSPVTSTSSKGAGAAITPGPWDAALLVAGGIAAALV